jgi:hypothetical protein
MSEEEDKKTTQAQMDAFQQMFQFYDAMSKSWAKTLSETVASKPFAESMGEQVESSLEAFSLMRRQYGDMFEQYLQQMNFPTRKEMVGLSERLTKIEMDLDDLHAKLDDILDLLKQQNA